MVFQRLLINIDNHNNRGERAEKVYYQGNRTNSSPYRSEAVPITPLRPPLSTTLSISTGELPMK